MTKVHSKIAMGMEDEPIQLHKKLLVLLIVGFTIIFVGITLVIAAVFIGGEGSASFGGVVFIWFIPIVFGVGIDISWILIFALILAAVGFIMLLVWIRGRSEKNP